MIEEKIKLAVLDDHSMVREALSHALENTGKVKIIGQAGTSAELTNILRQSTADIVLMDYSMPNIDPLILAEQIINSFGVKVLFFSLHENPAYAVKTLQIGASGFVVKSDDITDLLEAIQSVQQGKLYLSKSIQSEVLKKLSSVKSEKQGLDLLSPREFEFLRAYTKEGSLSETAKTLGVSLSTASTYRSRVMLKLQITSNADLIRFSLDNNLNS